MMAPHNPLARLSAEGQSVWIDYLSRDLIESGELARVMREDAVVGVTSNPSIYEKAISQGSAYDAQLKDVLTRERDPKEVFYQLVACDMESATDLLPSGKTPVISTATSPGKSTRHSYDREATVAEATRLHEWVAKPNL